MNITFKLRRTGDWVYYFSPELEARGIAQAFFTGASPYPLTRNANREEFLAAFGLADLVVMDQQHGDDVHLIRNGERPAAGDALVLTERNVAGVIKTADCLPVMLVEPGVPVAAIVHAGWRGTVRRITGKAVRAMVGLGASPNAIAALLGPAIGPCCYEVGEDVRDMFLAEGFPREIFREDDRGLSLNMKTANREVLKEEGIGAVFDLSLCTYCTGNLFHSYRRGEKEHRQINFISLKG